jgi:hypothetical protein
MVEMVEEAYAPGTGREGLMALFETIPENGFNGRYATSCLIGYPLSRGVLRSEWYAYVAAFNDGLEGDTMLTCHEWLARRFGVPDVAPILKDIYVDVAHKDLAVNLPVPWSMPITNSLSSSNQE